LDFPALPARAAAGAPPVRVVAEAGDGTQAVDASRRTRPDVVLMDIRMPVMDGLEATRQLIASEAPPRVLMLTTFDLDEYVFDALVAGASGFLLKDVAPEHLLSAIHTIARGDSLLAPSVTRRLIEAYVRDHPPAAAPAPGLDELTARERETLVHIGDRGIGVVAASPPSRVRGRRGLQVTKIACSRLVPAARLSRSGISATPLPLGLRIQKRPRGDSVPTITSPA
jgi:DNA-binding NarL/FixJ family response regulator